MTEKRRVNDKIHIDKAIPIYEIAAMVLSLVVILGTVITYQGSIDSGQDAQIIRNQEIGVKNQENITALKESNKEFQEGVLTKLNQINDRGDRQEDKAEEFFDRALDIIQLVKDKE